MRVLTDAIANWRDSRRPIFLFEIISNKDIGHERGMIKRLMTFVYDELAV